MDQQEAFEQIKLIRETMQQATRRFFFSPWQWIEWGIVVIIAGLTTQWMIAANKSEHIVLLWVAAFIIGSVLEGVAWVLEAQHRGYDPFSPIYLKMWGIFLCMMLPGVIFTIVLVQINLPLYLVGLWLITIASVMFVLVILGERRELMLFGMFMLIGGLLSLSLLLQQAMLVGVACFGMGGLLMGVYLLIKDKTIKKEDLK